MGLKAEVQFAGFIFKAMVVFRQMHQVVDSVGKPFGRPTGHLVDLVFESTKETTEFLAWLLSQNMKEIKIVFSPVTGNGKSRTIWLRDAYCIFFKEHFISTTTQPMTTTITISAGIVDDGGVIHFEYWKVSDIVPPKMVEPTPVPREIKPKLVNCIFVDTDGNEVESLTEGKTQLAIKTKDMAGKKITIDLSDSNFDFLYKGELLKDDILKDLPVKSSNMNIKLEVIAQKIN